MNGKMQQDDLDEGMIPKFEKCSDHVIEQEVLLVKRDICRWNDKNINPYELVLVRCDKCRDYDEGQRTILQDRGWRTAFHPDYDDAEQFMLCPKCSGAEYVWEDLY